MQDIAELERRITAALERIARGVEGLQSAPQIAVLTPLVPDAPAPHLALPGAAPSETAAPEPTATPAYPDLTAELARMSDALDEERMANAQLHERLKVVRDKEAKLRGALEEQIATLMRQVDAQGLELSRAHQTMVQQGGQLRALREAAEAGLADPSLINRTLQVELDALRTSRSIEVAELDDILSALDPLLAEEGGPDART